MKSHSYRILPVTAETDMQGSWDGPFWGQVAAVALDCFRPEGSGHRPRTLCKMLYNDRMILCFFQVKDQFVRCIQVGFQSDVWKDSCVEFFVQLQNSKGYFNFEFNCGGTLLASYVTDPTRVNGRLVHCTPLDAEDDRQILRRASLPQVLETEITDPLTWYLEFAIPVSVFEKYAGKLGNLPGQIWRANFYKCGNETSHPHWASWMPLRERNFHDPACFGELIFVPRKLKF